MIRTRVDSLLETKRKNMQDIRYKKNRREFLSTSAKSLALLGIALQGGFVFAKESNKGIFSIQHKPMPKRILGCYGGFCLSLWLYGAKLSSQ